MVRGLYNGMNAGDIHNHKGLKKNEKILILPPYHHIIFTTISQIFTHVSIQKVLAKRILSRFSALYIDYFQSLS